MVELKGDPKVITSAHVCLPCRRAIIIPNLDNITIKFVTGEGKGAVV